ncbi:uncharacterized protein LOC111278446 [Durio zibethinus]|uniref:Uncharacterized protein LOC111278446 n=1 Tax=Durio zibethinus TaxID=66656 RepID=A0A6P5WZ46_DURZI|nr:uncharacterized protein LOC111278446 [Durio zibethinus]
MLASQLCSEYCHCSTLLAKSSRPLESLKSGDSDEEPNERKKLRRMSISKANKGNTPWNKDRKHGAVDKGGNKTCNAESVKMKLVNLGHAQSSKGRKPTPGTQSKQIPSKMKSSDINYSSTSETIIPIERLRLQRRNKPLYRDPMASSKLEMLKNIRAKRVGEESKKTEAVERARLLIVEAEKAVKAPEVAAVKSPVVRASLIESRKLIAEAIQLIESIER